MNKPSISILVDVPLMRILGVLTTCLDTSACMGWVHRALPRKSSAQSHRKSRLILPDTFESACLVLPK